MGNRAKAAVTKAESKSNNSISKKQKSDSFKSINSPVDYILYLQRTIGNQAVQKLFKFGAIQPKPRINQPGDTYEQEADRRAEEEIIKTIERSGQSSEASRNVELRRQSDEAKREEMLQTKVPPDQRFFRDRSTNTRQVQVSRSVRAPVEKARVQPSIQANGTKPMWGRQPITDTVYRTSQLPSNHDFVSQRINAENRNANPAGSQVGCWLTRESHITSGALRRREATTPSRRTLPNTIQLQPTPSSTTSRTIPPKLDKQTVVGPMDTIDCGGYYWGIRWKLDRPTKKGGYVVQMVGSWVNVKDCRGRPVRVQDRVKEYNPRNYPFWEAWKIGKNQTGTGKHIDDSYWWLQGVGEGTKGFIQDLGYANYYDGLVLPSSFKVDKNSPARLAPMTKTNPNLTGGSGPVLHTLKAEWNCCPDSASKKTKLTPK
jgi:hypothetical protein